MKPGFLFLKLSHTFYKKLKTVATKIEENVSIPADKFEVPKGVVMTDM
ncbi:MAG: hypothetical protein ABIQ56_03530 [Chitinophagaceae bacterium]